jgi:hypothetical protein
VFLNFYDKIASILGLDVEGAVDAGQIAGCKLCIYDDACHAGDRSNSH